MGKIVKIRYFTDDKKALINKDNLVLYEKYLKSSILKNKEVENTTYKVYKSNMTQFLVYLSEDWNNVGLYEDSFFEDAIDIIEGYMGFCVDTLKNNKKAVNNKVAAISSFYLWSMKRRLVPMHPFDKKIDRMQGANDEKIINSYFLNDEEVERIKEGLKDSTKFDIQDKILFEIALDSANRIGALEKLILSSFDLENMLFKDIREKRGYRVEVAFSESTRDLINEWLEMRKEMDNLEIDSLFISRYNNQYNAMKKGTLQNRIRKMGKILGIEDFHAHCIRKTTLNMITEKTGDISLAAEIGNHKSIETTRQSYVKPKSKAETRDKIKQMMSDLKDK